MGLMCHAYSSPLTLYWKQGNWLRIFAKDMAFDYRHSILHERKGIVTEAVFGLRQGDRKEISAVMASYKDRRRRTQPLQSATAGSVFATRLVTMPRG